MLKVKGILREYSDKELTTLFKHTGGVGRYINLEVDDKHNLEDILEDVIVKMEENSQLMQLLFRVYLKIFDNGFDIWKPQYIKRSDLKELGIQNSVMNHWCDLSIFFQCIDGYCLLFPCLYEYLAHYFQNTPDKRMRCAMQALFIGYDGSGSAGAVNILVIILFLMLYISSFWNNL